MSDIPQVDLSGTIFVDVTTAQQYLGEFSELLRTPAAEVKDESLENQETPTSASSDPQKTNDTDKNATDYTIQARRVRCPECHRYTCETEEKMQRHIRKVHRGENPFQCYMCDYSTYNKSLFEEHVRIHQGIKPFKCSHCPYRSVSKKNTKKHELIHRPDNPLKCTNCDFIARNTRALLCHQKMHEVEVKSEDDASKKCSDCKFRYKRPDELRKHRKSKKICEVCDYVACTRALYTAHMYRKHKFQSENKSSKVRHLFNCALCSWGSNNKPRILLHLIHHPNQTVDENVVDVSILRQCGIME